jgi:hypothetical protein
MDDKLDRSGGFLSEHRIAVPAIEKSGEPEPSMCATNGIRHWRTRNFRIFLQMIRLTPKTS